MMNNMSQGLGSFNNMMPQNNMQQNPYGQQMNPQMMGQQTSSPEMFSEQLMAPNQMNPVEDPMQGLQPMAEPEGFGVYGESLPGFANGGAAFAPSSDFNADTGEFYSNSNTYGSMDDGSLFYRELGPNNQPVYRITQRPDLPDLSFDNFQDAYGLATGNPAPAAVVQQPGPVEQQMVEQTMPTVGSPNAVVPQAPMPAVEAQPYQPIAPVGVPQNYGNTPTQALNFDPNTYMQTPQQSNVALPSMFQQSNPYTFEELLSQYKPAYPNT